MRNVNAASVVLSTTICLFDRLTVAVTRMSLEEEIRARLDRVLFPGYRQSILRYGLALMLGRLNRLADVEIIPARQAAKPAAKSKTNTEPSTPAEAEVELIKT